MLAIDNNAFKKIIAAKNGYELYTKIGDRLYWKYEQYGILGHGFDGHYENAEKFMIYIIDPASIIDYTMKTGKYVELDFDMFEPSYPYPFTVYESVLTRCLSNGFYFEEFLNACNETKAMDIYFLSDDFMTSVECGHWHGRWNIKMQGETSLDAYRNRFRVFIQSLNARLDWTNAYLKYGQHPVVYKCIEQHPHINRSHFINLKFSSDIYPRKIYWD